MYRSKILAIFLFLFFSIGCSGQKLFWLWQGPGNSNILTRSYLHVHQKVHLVLLDTNNFSPELVKLESPSIIISKITETEYSFYNNSKTSGCSKVYLVLKKTGQKLDSTILANTYYPYYFETSPDWSYDLFGEYDFHDLYFRGAGLLNKVKILSLDIELIDTNNALSYKVHLDSSHIPDTVRNEIKSVYTDGHFIILKNIRLQEGENPLFIKKYILILPGEKNMTQKPIEKFQWIRWRGFSNLVPDTPGATSYARNAFYLGEGRKVEEKSYLYFYQKIGLVLDSFKLQYKNVDLWSPGITIKRLNDREYSFFNDNKERDCNKVYLIERKTRKKLDSTILLTDFFPLHFNPTYPPGCLSGFPAPFEQNNFRGLLANYYEETFTNTIKVMAFDVEITDTNNVVSFQAHLNSNRIPDPVRNKMKEHYTNGDYLIYRNVILEDGDHILRVPIYIQLYPGSMKKDWDRFQKFFKANEFGLELLRSR